MSKIKKLSAFILLILIIMQLCGCAVYLPDPVVISSDDEALAMGFSQGDYQEKLKVGEYTWLPVNIKFDYEYALKWYSADPEIATVDSSGRVDGISPGKTTITVRAKSASLTYHITVVKGKSEALSHSTAYTSNEDSVQQNIVLNISANPYAMLINVNTGCATVYTYNNSGVYNKAVRSMVCSVGKGESSELGSYVITEKSRWHASDDGKFYQYYSVFANNDGGLALSSTAYKAQSASSLIASEYNKLGIAYTSGEIRFSVDDAKWIYENCVEGTLVKLANNENKSDPLDVPDPMRIPKDAKYQNWDPTDSNEKNPYNKMMPVFEGVEDTYIIVNTTFDAYEGVVAYDSCGNRFEDGIKVDGKVVCTRKGTYVITYLFTDAMGRTGRVDRNVHVVSQAHYNEIMENN